MVKMSRYVLFVLIIAVAGSIITGCSTNPPAQVDDTTSVLESMKEIESLPMNVTDKIEKEEVKAAGAPEINNAVVYEGNGVVITATGIEKSWDGWTVKLLIENNSSLSLGFRVRSIAVNGIMFNYYIYSDLGDVAAGKKANVVLEIQDSYLDEYGITEVRCIDLHVWAYDNDKAYKEFDTGQIEIQTSLYDGTHDLIEGTTIYDADGVKVDYLKTDGNEYSFCITNNTGEGFQYSFEELSINDFSNSEQDYNLIGHLLNNCQVVVPVSVSEEFLSANAIDAVESIEWRLHLLPMDDFSNDTKIGPIVYNVE